jgi:phosphoribosylformylglycinamidine synthase
VLQREPNFTELCAYSGMWSEHCSYKNSIVWLKTLPKEGPHMLAKAGEENAGLVDIGDGLACAFKIESHNHPSAIEPYQGAATGVGGINRDIFTMGARPIAQLNSLRFGDITHPKTKHLIKGVVKGIGEYGNSFGVPTVAGEVFFDDSFQTNPLVNAMSVGLVNIGETVKAIAYGKGNPVFIVGSSTGKDGIGGAAFASKDITEESAKDLPSVQVGDPFQEKLLLEATLEVIKTGAVIGMQDMGAAGIICSTSEMSAKGNAGMKIYLDRVPTRQKDMHAWELLLSESQERMLIVAEKGKEKAILEVFEKWDLNCVEIGEVIDEDMLYFYHHNELVAKIPPSSLVLGGGAPVYHREYSEPAYFEENKKFEINTINEPTDLKPVAKFLMSHPNIASKKWIYEQYDAMVGTVNMSVNEISDAAIVNVKASNKALAVTVDCNSRYVYADPEQGCAIAVAEAARNIVCSGGVPSAVTNCLNFGNPYHPEVYWQFVNAIKGMRKACITFKTPVTGGNVSFYNQSNSVDKKGGNVSNAVFPTPTIGMIGILEDKKLQTTISFKQAKDLIFLLGHSRNDINASEYLYSWHKVNATPAPYLDLKEELALQEVVQKLIREKLVKSAHDVSDGGLFVTLAEKAMAGNFGFNILSDSDVRLDAFLFGESQSRVVVTINPNLEDEFVEILEKTNVAFVVLGEVTKKTDFVIDDEKWMNVEEAKELYYNAIENHMNA